MPWHGWPPAPARPTTGDGKPTNSLTISAKERSDLWIWILTVQSHDGKLNLKLVSGGAHGGAERGVRSRWRQSPGAGLLGHEAHRRVLHAGARHAADQDAGPARRVWPAL